MALGPGPYDSPRGGAFFMSEVPLYMHEGRVGVDEGLWECTTAFQDRRGVLQGYLAHKKTPTLLRHP